MYKIKSFLEKNNIGYTITDNKITICGMPEYVSMGDIVKYINSCTEYTVSGTTLNYTLILV